VEDATFAVIDGKIAFEHVARRAMKLIDRERAAVVAQPLVRMPLGWTSTCPIPPQPQKR